MEQQYPELDDKEFRRSIARDLFRLRELTGLSKKEWAEKTGIARGVLYKFENEERIPSPSTLNRLFRALDLRLKDAEQALDVVQTDRSQRYLQYCIARTRWDLKHGAEYRRQVRANVGSRVREERERQGLTQDELASRAGLSKGLTWQLEAGKYRGSQKTWLGYLAEVARALGRSSEQFQPQPRDVNVFARTSKSDVDWVQIQRMRGALRGDDLSHPLTGEPRDPFRDSG